MIVNVESSLLLVYSALYVIDYFYDYSRGALISVASGARVSLGVCCIQAAGCRDYGDVDMMSRWIFYTLLARREESPKGGSVLAAELVVLDVNSGCALVNRRFR